MNTAQLVEQVAKTQKISKASAKAIIGQTLSSIKIAVKKGNEVRLIGFGTFKRAKRNARVGRNPQTGAKVKIPAHKVPKFRPGSDFKALVK